MRLTDHSARSVPTACWDGLRGTVRCSSVAAVEQALPKSRARAGGHGIVLILRACDWSKSLDFIGLWARVHCRIVVLKSAKSPVFMSFPPDIQQSDSGCRQALACTEGVRRLGASASAVPCRCWPDAPAQSSDVVCSQYTQPRPPPAVSPSGNVGPGPGSSSGSAAGSGGGDGSSRCATSPRSAIVIC